MDYLMQADIHRVVAETLSDLGKPHARLSCLNLRALIRDGYCTGHAIEYENIRIVLLTDATVRLCVPTNTVGVMRAL
jgi:hypothetical protein